MIAPAGDIPRVQPLLPFAPAQHTSICFFEQPFCSGFGANPDRPRSGQRWGLGKSEAVSYSSKVLARNREGR
ncbi:hypothetical protein CSHISOI_07567 [Colletotrichum shisoi]|uniref:Uncharacterized protein n=1 Tax=Colletotrichum shisoi TaxID=2078593 RepID=A0A5Q4BN36_9PEZI|nr:hypothetical protein CSHISOI_07567 [Colletotrichum shisoi]